MKRSVLCVGSCLLLLTSSAWAQSEGEASGGFSLSTDSGASGDADASASSESASGDTNAEGASAGEVEYIYRWPPEAETIELGIFAGLLFPSSEHNLHSSGTQVPFSSPALDLGLRGGYFPLEYLGVEAELAFMPTSTDADPSEAVMLYAPRAHVVGQLPGYSITPFAVLGAGWFGALGSPEGNDTDPGLHFGVGGKAALNEKLHVRLDLRDTLIQKNRTAGSGGELGDLTHNPEVLLGIGITLGRKEKAYTPQDTDGDGFMDPDDSCPEQPGGPPDGCPKPGDTDGDGVLDPQDSCPKVFARTPDGCPDPDPDKDGILGDADKCPNVPETKNGYQDADGCADEVPEDVKAFTGVIEGIEFDFGRATIREKSKAKLDEAARVLINHADLRVMISGHTDSVGGHGANVDLSKRRAESVKRYLVSVGVEPERIETEGAGPDRPIATNATPAGRQRNRRIEFKLIQ